LMNFRREAFVLFLSGVFISGTLGCAENSSPVY
jgi:hypothetical protein